MPDTRPNVVFIITDQQRYDTIAALGYPYMETPNLDRLVTEGISVTNCFVTAPTCAPSRASLFTGYYPHTTGIYNNEDIWQHSWVEELAASGYHCVNIGKMHTHPYETPLGFHERLVVENKDRYLEGRFFFDRWDLAMQARGLVKQQRELYRGLPDYRQRLGAFEWKLPEELHSDFYVGNLARWWIENKPDKQPFFLQVGFPGPHPPYDPIPRYAKPYLQKDLPLPQVMQDELAAQPIAHKELIQHNIAVDHDSIVWSSNPTPQQLHRLRAYYFANVTMIDEMIGGIMKALAQKGYLDDTVIIFTSDHGDCLGDHGHIQKWVMYDVITKVPLIVWNPNHFQGGRKVEELCQLFDIAPLILELARVDVPETWEARSLWPLIRGSKTGSGRTHVFSQQKGVSSENPMGGFLTGTRLMTMVRERTWKLVHYLDDKDQGELYNLLTDPLEQQNLWENPANRTKKEELIRVLLHWRMQSGLKSGDWTIPWR